MIRPLQQFFRLEAAGGIVLLGAAIAALLWANAGESYARVFGGSVAVHAGGAALEFTARQVIDDGLMTLFFFLVGMEIKRELISGELRSFGRAILPLIAAGGGMLAPALIYLALNPDGVPRAGWGIPMATDIAFCIGVLTLVSRRVPRGLVVFVTALAIFDDIGGILVIALFYGHGISLAWLAAAAVIALAIHLAGRRIRAGAFYAAAGAALWLVLHQGGIHATLSGVVLGLLVPGRGDAAPLSRFIERLHPYVAFGIMPLFALANSGIDLGNVTWADLGSGVVSGTALGLLFGKTAGVFLFTLAAVRLGVAPMPGRASGAKLLGASVVCGIGFTVALFIAALAFSAAPQLLEQAKLGILVGSLLSGVLGAALLRATPVLRESEATAAIAQPEPGDRAQARISS